MIVSERSAERCFSSLITLIKNSSGVIAGDGSCMASRVVVSGTAVEKVLQPYGILMFIGSLFFRYSALIALGKNVYMLSIVMRSIGQSLVGCAGDGFFAPALILKNRSMPKSRAAAAWIKGDVGHNIRVARIEVSNRIGQLR